jgi:hypothetical protein
MNWKRNAYGCVVTEARIESNNAKVTRIVP